MPKVKNPGKELRQTIPYWYTSIEGIEGKHSKYNKRTEKTNSSSFYSTQRGALERTIINCRSGAGQS
jgi:hypothetical protein